MPEPRLIELDEVDSTNLHARRLIEAGESQPFAVKAGVQHAGRGRLGRSWASPSGGVWLTVASPTSRELVACQPLPLLVALAVHEVLERILKPEHRAALRIKWPNDLLHGGQKLAGILCERVECAGSSWTLAGIGINADVDAACLGKTLRPPVSLRGLAPFDDIRPQTLGPRIASAVLSSFAEFEASGLPRGAMQAVAARLAWLDESVSLHRVSSGDDRYGDRECEGVLAGVDERGAAVLRTSQGLRHVSSGELDDTSLRIEPNRAGPAAPAADDSSARSER